MIVVSGKIERIGAGITYGGGSPYTMISVSEIGGKRIKKVKAYQTVESYFDVGKMRRLKFKEMFSMKNIYFL